MAIRRFASICHCSYETYIAASVFEYDHIDRKHGQLSDFSDIRPGFVLSEIPCHSSIISPHVLC